jgi:hypothetical protein
MTASCSEIGTMLKTRSRLIVRRLAASATALALALAIGAAPVGASSGPHSTTLTLTKIAGGATIGWQAVGDPSDPDTLNDGGTWTVQVEQPSFSGAGHFVAGVLYTTQYGALGTFRLRWYEQATEPIAPGANSDYLNGSWEVEPGSGTGAYANLSGHGLWTSVRANGVLTFSGDLQVMGL